MTSGPGRPQPGWPRLGGDARQRRWLRVLLLLVVAFVAALYGWVHRPRAQEAPDVVGPSIVVLADQPRVAATVTMNLSVRRNGRSSELIVTITPTSSISGTVGLTIELNDFPAGAKGTLGTPARLTVVSPAASSLTGSVPEAALPAPRGYRDYAITQQFVANGAAPPAPVTITIVAPRPIGEAARGSQLRVGIPELVGEGPGANPNVGYPIQNLFSGPPNVQTQAKGYPLALQAGLSTFSDTSVRLSAYEILAGDSPTLLGRQWTWSGINAATVLAANVGEQDQQQKFLFYSGIALGVAASAVIALLLELIPSGPAEESPAPGGNAEEAPEQGGNGEEQDKRPVTSS